MTTQNSLAPASLSKGVYEVKKIVITTLGCKVNQFESAAFKTGFEDRGYTIVTDPGLADLIVINTCAVTASAGAQSRQAVRRAIRANPDAELLVTGCYAEIGAKELAKEKELEGRNYRVIGNSKKDSLVQLAFGDKIQTAAELLGSIGDAKEICRLPVRKFGERSRAYLRIQDGCESFCTYCIVPYTRGPSRSLPVQEVIEQARVFASEGHKELVLTGIHLGNYGKDLNPAEDFVSLLDTLSLATPGVSYRISSLEPMEISEQLLEMMQVRPNIQPHLHIPLQSGDNDILARMNRRYTTQQFQEVVNNCKSWLPHAAIGIDILVGFPGETEEQFSKCKAFLRSLDFTYLHVFPYSIRPGTPAASFKGQISKQIKDKRVAELRAISDNKKREFYTSQLDSTLPVLVESRRSGDGFLKGFTNNYVAVLFDGPDNLQGSETHVRLLSLQGDTVLGERVRNHEN